MWKSNDCHLHLLSLEKTNLTRNFRNFKKVRNFKIDLNFRYRKQFFSVQGYKQCPSIKTSKRSLS